MKKSYVDIGETKIANVSIFDNSYKIFMIPYIWIFNIILLYILGGVILLLIIIEIREIIKEETNFLKTYGSRFTYNIKN